MTRHLVAAFRPHSEGLATIFGSLEADIMAVLWGRREARHAVRGQ
ncbi:MAG TPA: hypothetical protein VF897_19265 [Roseiflexaceae bacterium]